MCHSPEMQKFLEMDKTRLQSQFWALTLRDFCPNTVLQLDEQSSSHFSSLFDISKNSEQQTAEEVETEVLTTCVPKVGENTVQFTILFPEVVEGDFQHVLGYYGDEISSESIVDWMPDVSSESWLTMIYQTEFSLLRGIRGMFRNDPVKMKIGRAVRLTGLDKDALLAAKEDISDRNYDLLYNNCAHQLARVVEAGLGCEIADIPFLLPDAVFWVASEIGEPITGEDLQDIQDHLDEVGFDETFTYNRLMRRLLSTARWLLN